MKKILLIIFAVIMLTVLYAMMNKNTARPGINHIALVVEDLASATAFYREIIFLEEIPEPFKDGKHSWFNIGGGAQLHLIEAAYKKEEKNKNTHLCFSVPDLEKFIARLDAAGINWGNWPGEAKKITLRTDGIQQIYFQDPDGNWLEINNDH